MAFSNSLRNSRLSILHQGQEGVLLYQFSTLFLLLPHQGIRKKEIFFADN